MNKRLLILVCVLCACALGCLPSFHPFWTPDTKVTVPEINGTWRVVAMAGSDPGQRNPWVFSGNDVTVYDDKNNKGHLEVTYFKIDDVLYADTLSSGAEEGINSEWLCHTLGVHDLCRVELKGDKAEIWAFDYDVFKEGLKDGSIDLPFVQREDLILFTATPEQWVAFLKQNGKDARFYEKRPLYAFERVKAKQASQPEG